MSVRVSLCGMFRLIRIDTVYAVSIMFSHGTANMYSKACNVQNKNIINREKYTAVPYINTIPLEEGARVNMK